MKHLLLMLFLCSVAYLEAGTLVLNELMSRNTSTVADEDGSLSDWIELYNNGSEAVDLNGWALSDNSAKPFKWTFPALSLAPGKHLLVFASNKNRRELYYLQAIITQGDLWRYFPGTAEPPAAWKSLGFNDSSWKQGPSGFGYGDDDDVTIVNNVLSIYVRKTFTVQRPQDVHRLFLHVDFDDGFIAYLNGVETARANMGEPNQFFAYNTPATAGHEAQIYQGQSPPLFEINPALLRSGTNVLALQVHNINSTSSDLTLIPFLTAELTTPSAQPSPPAPILNLKPTNLHTNFKLDRSGETVLLTAPDSTAVDSVRLPALPAEVSYGRTPDGGDVWRMLAVPTPGAANNSTEYLGEAEPPSFSQPGGLYSAPVTLQLSVSGGGSIVYTLDGSVPTERSPRYSTPLRLSRSTVVRARTLQSPLQPSRIITHTYLFNENSPFALICLTTDPENLYDPDYGIFELGPNASSDYPYFGANFWQDWERPVHVEFFEPDGRLGFKLDAGLKVFGGWSRGRPQKSLAVFRRADYDTAEIRWRIFPDKEIDRFESFLLRNGGNDWDGTYWRDGFMQTLCRDAMNLETMAFRPTHVYLNGEYWGILNLREKLNEHFVHANRGFDPDQVDVLDGSGTEDWQVMAGSKDAYVNLLAFLNSHSLADPAHYAVVDSLIDIDNYIDYQIAEQFIGNTDWPGNNIKFYRPHHTGGKWRWLIYDTDFGFHLYDTAYDFNMLAFATQSNGPSWPNPPWSTFLLRKLLENETFRRKFINRFADHLNTTFEPVRVKELLDRFDAMFKSEINRQRQRWPGSMGEYTGRLARMRTFADRRVPFVRTHIRSYFQLKGFIDVILNVQGHGSIQLNTIRIDRFPWTGKYFQEVPITLKAVPAAGYRFVRWSRPEFADKLEVEYSSAADLVVTAVFEPSDLPATVVISEINYSSSPQFPAEDWIELYNPTPASISLAGWTLRDKSPTHLFELPEGAVVPAEGCAVIAVDTLQMKKLFPGIRNLYGNLPFGLSNSGDAVALYDAEGRLIDSLAYGKDAPWPAVGGSGRTLELTDPGLDRTLPSIWAASRAFGGSPGKTSFGQSTHAGLGRSLPLAFTLQQNYPNPFNGETLFRYALPQPGRVTLQLYDLLGRSVLTLLDEEQAAGEHQHQSRIDLPSGVYFYRLTFSASGRKKSLVKKMMLVR